MKKSRLSLFLIAIFVTPSAFSISDSQSQSILRLGELNGIALKCQYIKQARHIKLSLAQSLPKLRGLGEMYEEETNRSFLEFIKGNKACPGEATIEEAIQKAITNMQNLFQQSKQKNSGGR